MTHASALVRRLDRGGPRPSNAALLPGAGRITALSLVDHPGQLPHHPLVAETERGVRQDGVPPRAGAGQRMLVDNDDRAVLTPRQQRDRHARAAHLPRVRLQLEPLAVVDVPDGRHVRESEPADSLAVGRGSGRPAAAPPRTTPSRQRASLAPHSIYAAGVCPREARWYSGANPGTSQSVCRLWFPGGSTMLNQRDRRQLNALARQLAVDDPELAEAFRTWQPPSSGSRPPRWPRRRQRRQRPRRRG
ncbi:MAG: DUF3040 domain-containing protein [Actinophytocola sp.]|nr:DUF3040 domain-containing protein [Actinophytocola sp.]